MNRSKHEVTWRLLPGCIFQGVTWLDKLVTWLDSPNFRVMWYGNNPKRCQNVPCTLTSWSIQLVRVWTRDLLVSRDMFFSYHVTNWMSNDAVCRNPRDLQSGCWEFGIKFLRSCGLLSPRIHITWLAEGPVITRAGTHVTYKQVVGAQISAVFESISNHVACIHLEFMSHDYNQKSWTIL